MTGIPTYATETVTERKGDAMTDRQTDPANTLFAQKKESLEDRINRVEAMISDLKRLAELHHGTIGELREAIGRITRASDDPAPANPGPSV